VKIGVTLPTFSPDATAVLDAARAAESAGIHGVFSFDHQWPLGHPERPSLSVYPMLGAVAAVTHGLSVGTLVARVGLLPDDVVVASIESLRVIAGDRVIAGLGTGDDASEPEHTRYGLPYLGVASRLERLRGVIERLRAGGIETWVGGGSAATNLTAQAAGASLNLWDAPPERIAKAVARSPVPITWGGPLRGGASEAAAQLQALREAGAAWAVWAWPSSLDLVCAAAALAGLELGSPAG
jgi:alkanesulfonate monooxygenase SsuD/methylene tetrahydromethanopterin reductase-like flavin-dependent oxidoreductase (luciferase family)